MLIATSSATFWCRFCILYLFCDTSVLCPIPYLHVIAHLKVTELLDIFPFPNPDLISLVLP